MKDILFEIQSVAMLILIAAYMIGCAFFEGNEAKSVIKQVLSDVQIACVLEKELLNAPEIEQACSIEYELRPVVDALLSSHRTAARREQTERSKAIFGISFDAGACQ